MILNFMKKKHVDRQYKLIDDIVSDKGPHKLDNTQHTTKEDLRNFPNTTGTYKVYNSEPLGHLVTEIL